MPETPFLDFPPELVERVLSFLSAKDIFSSLLTCKALHRVVDSSPILQLILETNLAGVNDNPYSELSITERLQRLRLREKNWNSFTFGARSKIPIEHNASTIYEVEANRYFLGDASHFGKTSTVAMNSVYLPESSEKKVWNRVDVGRTIIDIGLALEEHDLLAIVTR